MLYNSSTILGDNSIWYYRNHGCDNAAFSADNSHITLLFSPGNSHRAATHITLFITSSNQGESPPRRNPHHVIHHVQRPRLIPSAPEPTSRHSSRPATTMNPHRAGTHITSFITSSDHGESPPRRNPHHVIHHVQRPRWIPTTPEPTSRHSSRPATTVNPLRAGTHITSFITSSDHGESPPRRNPHHVIHHVQRPRWIPTAPEPTSRHSSRPATTVNPLRAGTHITSFITSSDHGESPPRRNPHHVIHHVQRPRWIPSAPEPTSRHSSRPATTVNPHRAGTHITSFITSSDHGESPPRRNPHHVIHHVQRPQWIPTAPQPTSRHSSRPATTVNPHRAATHITSFITSSDHGESPPRRNPHHVIHHVQRPRWITSAPEPTSRHSSRPATTVNHLRAGTHITSFITSSDHGESPPRRNPHHVIHHVQRPQWIPTTPEPTSRHSSRPATTVNPHRAATHITSFITSSDHGESPPRRNPHHVIHHVQRPRWIPTAPEPTSRHSTRPATTVNPHRAGTHITSFITSSDHGESPPRRNPHHVIHHVQRPQWIPTAPEPTSRHSSRPASTVNPHRAGTHITSFNTSSDHGESPPRRNPHHVIHHVQRPQWIPTAPEPTPRHSSREDPRVHRVC